MRRILLTFILLLAGLVAVQAAVVAQFRNLGFSPDGRYFAFMEHGVQDGSGFPFANIFVIDLQRDAWVSETPVRVILRQEADDARPAMRQALRRVQPILQRLRIDPLLIGRTVFHAPATEGVEPAMRAVFVLHPFERQQADRRYTLELGIHYLPIERSGCRPDEVMRARGFFLNLRAGQGAAVRIHTDESVPRSRNCPIAYALDRVIAFRTAWRAASRAVIIVRYAYQAFEGPDERYLAVPVMLPPLP